MSMKVNEWDESGSESIMKCEECRPLLERYFDADLGESTAELVSNHLASCAACAQAYEGLEREQNFYLRHEVEIEVSPTFWAHVSARTMPEKVAPARGLGPLLERFVRALGEFRALRFGPLFTTALVILAIGGTVAIMSYRAAREREAGQVAISQPNGEAVQTPTSTTANHETAAIPARMSGGESDRAGRLEVVQVQKSNHPRAASRSNIRSVDRRLSSSGRRQTPDELVREAEQKYLAAIAILGRDANRRRAKFDPAELAQFDQALAAVDRTIAGTRRAVREHPTDPVAVQYMLAAYAKKVDVLRQMVSD
jgi:hypothetical protein